MHSLPIANSATLASSLELKLHGSGVQSGETVGIVGRALSVSRAVAEDGKGFSVSYVAGTSIWYATFDRLG